MNSFHNNSVSNVSYRSTYQNPACHKSFVSQSQDLSFSSGSNQTHRKVSSAKLTSSWLDFDWSLLPQFTPDVSRINLPLPLSMYKPRSEIYHPLEAGFAGRSPSECGSVGSSSCNSDLSDNDRRMDFQPVIDDCFLTEYMQEVECQYQAVYRNVSNSPDLANFVKKNAATSGFIAALDLVWRAASGLKLSRSAYVHARAHRTFQVGETFPIFLQAFNKFASTLAASQADVCVTCQQQKVGKDDSHASKKHATVTLHILAPDEVMREFNYYLMNSYESAKHRRKNCFQKRDHISAFTNVLLHAVHQLNLDFQTGVATRTFKVRSIDDFNRLINMILFVDPHALGTKRVKVAFMMQKSGNATKGKGNSQSLPSFKYLVICYNAPSYFDGIIQNLELPTMFQINEHETVVTRCDEQFRVFSGLFNILLNLYHHKNLGRIGALEVGGVSRSSRYVLPHVQHSQYTEDAQEVIKIVSMIIQKWHYIQNFNIEFHNVKNTGRVQYRIWVGVPYGLPPCSSLTTYKYVNQHHVAGLFKPEKQEQAMKVYKDLFSNSPTELFKKQLVVRCGETAL